MEINGWMVWNGIFFEVFECNELMVFILRSLRSDLLETYQ